MYRVRIVSPDGIIVRSHMPEEPPNFQEERSLLLGLTNHWIDVERIPIDHYSDSFCVQSEEFILELLK